MAQEPATPAPETKAAKFTRLAEARVNATLDKIAQIGGLASKNNYEYTDAQVNAIEGALKGEIDVLMKRFRSPASVSATGFKFGS